MLFIHPAVQFLASILAMYVLYLGFQRFKMLHLKRKVRFNWKRHVFLGEITLGTFLVGILAGIGMVRISWGIFFVLGLHLKIGVMMVPFILFGFFSGLHMNRVKKKRTLLPPMHGLSNTIVLILALTQFITGWRALEHFVFG